MAKNFYIQGDPSRAKEIRAAFESKGFDVGTNSCAQKGLYFTFDGKVCYTDDYVYPRDMMLEILIKTHPDYQELELPTKHKFKMGDWIVRSNGSSDVPIQIYNLKKDRYLVTNMLGSKGELMINRQDEWHLWTIEDAKDGDVITNGKLIVIFNKLEEPAYKQHIIAYVGLDLCGRLQITEDTWQLGVDKAMPATKEQRDLLFKKMKEAGYQWDADKKELRKIIEPKFKVGDLIVWNKPKGSKPAEPVKIIQLIDKDQLYMVDKEHGVSYISYASQDYYELAPQFPQFQKGDLVCVEGALLGRVTDDHGKWYEIGGVLYNKKVVTLATQEDIDRIVKKGGEE